MSAIPKQLRWRYQSSLSYAKSEIVGSISRLSRSRLFGARSRVSVKDACSRHDSQGSDRGRGGREGNAMRLVAKWPGSLLVLPQAD